MSAEKKPTTAFSTFRQVEIIISALGANCLTSSRPRPRLQPVIKIDLANMRDFEVFNTQFKQYIFNNIKCCYIRRISGKVCGSSAQSTQLHLIII